MRNLLLTTVLLLILLVVGAQEKGDSLFIQQFGLKASFIHGDKILVTKDVLDLMRSNSMAYKSMKTSQIYHYSVYPMSLISAGLITYPIFDKIANDVVDIRLLVGGLALGMLTGFVNSTYKSKVRKAVFLYNQGINESAVRKSLRLEMLMNVSGVGVCLCF